MRLIFFSQTLEREPGALTERGKGADWQDTCGDLSIGRGEHSEVHVVHPKMARDSCQNHPLDITTQSMDI